MNKVILNLVQKNYKELSELRHSVLDSGVTSIKALISLGVRSSVIEDVDHSSALSSILKEFKLLPGSSLNACLHVRS